MLTYESADFALRSRMWKDPSANAYFTGVVTGAVSESQAWVLLPSECCDAIPSGVKQGNVPVVEVSVTPGKGTREALAQAAVSTAPLPPRDWVVPMPVGWIHPCACRVPPAARRSAPIRATPAG